MTRSLALVLLSLTLTGCPLEGGTPSTPSTPAATPECLQESDAEVITYLPLDQCTAALVGCDTGGEYFEDSCGCGCIETGGTDDGTDTGNTDTGNTDTDDTCTTPDNANVLMYLELDECTASLVGCDAGGEYFEDACGCGCLLDEDDAPVDDTCVDPNDADVLMYLELEDCLASLVGCDAGGEYFEDACGCGCLVE